MVILAQITDQCCIHGVTHVTSEGEIWDPCAGHAATGPGLGATALLGSSVVAPSRWNNTWSITNSSSDHQPQNQNLASETCMRLLGNAGCVSWRQGLQRKLWVQNLQDWVYETLEEVVIAARGRRRRCRVEMCCNKGFVVSGTR